jgi:hypothetical protein
MQQYIHLQTEQMNIAIDEALVTYLNDVDCKGDKP